MKAYVSFCSSHGVAHPFPASPANLALFATDAAARVKVATVRSYMSAIKLHHIEQGLAWPGMEQCVILERCLKGLAKLQGPSNRRPRLPITYGVLSRLRPFVDLTRHDGRMFWAAATSAFFGFLRCGEFAHSSGHSPDKLLRRSHLTVVSLITCAFTFLLARPTCFGWASTSTSGLRGCQRCAQSRR